MPHHLISENELTSHSGLPPIYAGRLLPNAQKSFTKTNTFLITTQLITGQNYFIRHTLAKGFANYRVKSTTTNPGLYIRIQLKNSQRLIINDKLRIHIRENQFCGSILSDFHTQQLYFSKQEYESLDIYYSFEFLQQFIAAFPESNVILQNLTSSSIVFKPNWLNHRLQEIINLLFNPYVQHGIMCFHYDLRVQELLGCILQYELTTVNKITLSAGERYRIHQVRNWLKLDLSRKIPPLHTIARQFGVPEYKLRKGFMQEFGATISNWLKTERMIHAKQLLLYTSFTIDEIAEKIGYSHTSTFIAAYSTKFGATPGSYRTSK